MAWLFASSSKPNQRICKVKPHNLRLETNRFFKDTRSLRWLTWLSMPRQPANANPLHLNKREQIYQKQPCNTQAKCESPVHKPHNSLTQNARWRKACAKPFKTLRHCRIKSTQKPPAPHPCKIRMQLFDCERSIFYYLLYWRACMCDVESIALQDL